MIELPENAQHPQGTLRTPVMMAVIAVMISLFPLLFACSSEGSKDHSEGSRRTDEGQRAGKPLATGLERRPPHRNTGGPRPDRPPELDRGKHQHARAFGDTESGRRPRVP